MNTAGSILCALDGTARRIFDWVIVSVNQESECIQMTFETATKHHVRPRFRAYGRARIEIARRAKTPQEWDMLWKKPQFEFPFSWGPYWKQCIEYRVDDFAAEVGFYIDVLGFPVNVFQPDYAMFTSPQGDFYFSVLQTPPAVESTPPDSFRMQFMIEDIRKTAAELERRGVVFEQPPAPIPGEPSVYVASFCTPHGICIDLWSLAPVEKSHPLRTEPSNFAAGMREGEIDPHGRQMIAESNEQGVASPDDTPEEPVEVLFEDEMDEPEDEPGFGFARKSAPPQADNETEPEYIDEEETEDEDLTPFKPFSRRR